MAARKVAADEVPVSRQSGEEVGPSGRFFCCLLKRRETRRVRAVKGDHCGKSDPVPVKPSHQASSRKAPPQHLDDVGAAGASSNGAGTQSSVKIGAGGTRQEAVPAGIAEVEREVHTDNLQESSSERDLRTGPPVVNAEASHEAQQQKKAIQEQEHEQDPQSPESPLAQVPTIESSKLKFESSAASGKAPSRPLIGPGAQGVSSPELRVPPGGDRSQNEREHSGSTRDPLADTAGAGTSNPEPGSAPDMRSGTGRSLAAIETQLSQRRLKQRAAAARGEEEVEDDESGSRKGASVGASPSSLGGDIDGAADEAEDMGPPPDCDIDEVCCCLRVIKTPSGKKEAVKVVHPGEGEQCKVGRHWRCSFVLDDGEVSSEHLVVWWSEDSETGWFVADLGSLNGTILNDAVISAEGRVRGGDHTLRHGDTLVLASGTVIRVTMLDEETAEDAELHAGGGRPRGGLGGKGAAMLRKAQNQGATMRKKEGDEKDEGYPFLVKRERRADFGVADIPEDAGARSLAASSIGVMAAMRVRQGVSHARDGRPCEDQALVSVPSSGPRGLVFTVLDGHFGTRAAMMAKHRLAKVLPGLAAEAPAEDGYGPALASAFKELDALICGQCEEGCTATVVPVWETAPGRLAVQSVNVGDSFAVLLPLSPGSEPRELTGNHRVDQDAEFERIASYNLSAEKLGGYDRGHTRLLGFQLARCLGDAMFKTECPAIVSDPSISSVVEVPEDGAVLIIASDGLWDGVSPGEAARLVKQAVDSSDLGPSTAEMLAEVRDKLVEMALDARSKDDISVMVALLHPALRGRETNSVGRMETVAEGTNESRRGSIEAPVE